MLTPLYPSLAADAETTLTASLIIDHVLDGSPYFFRPQTSPITRRPTGRDHGDRALQLALKALTTALRGNSHITAPGLAHGLMMVALGGGRTSNFEHKIMLAAFDIVASADPLSSTKRQTALARALAVTLDLVVYDLEQGGAKYRAHGRLKPNVRPAPTNPVQAAHELCLIAAYAASLIGAPRDEVKERISDIKECLAYLAADKQHDAVKTAVQLVAERVAALETVQRSQSAQVAANAVTVAA